ncbi:MAG TPA: hypothetical protein PLZ24_16325 [Flavobacteriales bacterium]|nr:hypothetical protein [Flavobacteriales bacterium]
MTPDIFDLVALAVAVVIAAYLMACEWAKDDNAEANRKNDKGDTSGLNHRQLLAWRLAELFVGLGLCFLVLLWTGSTMWYLLPLAGMAWAVFGSQHVWKLNKLRGKDWRYLSPGNVWDWFWLRTNGFINRAGCMEDWNEFYSEDDNLQTKAHWQWLVHKAGNRAMIFRAVVFAVSVGGYALILFA